MMRKIALCIMLLILVVYPLGGISSAQEGPTNEQCAAPSWSGTMFPTPDFSGTPHAVLCRRIIHFDWGTGSPWKGLDVDNFSFRWATQYQFPSAGKYMFALSVAGGVRFTFNNQVLVDALEDAPVRTYTIEYDITTPGVAVPIVIESAHWGGEAQLKFAWYLISGGSAGATADHDPTLSAGEEAFTNDGGNVWYIENYDNPSFSGSPVSNQLHVADGAEFFYGDRAPSAGMPEDGWSARWTRMVDFPAGNYTFTLRADDGARVLVDGQVVVKDTFTGQTGTGSVQLTEGRHEIVLEHADMDGESMVFLTWDPPVGTMLLPNGCNARFSPGINGNAPLCAGSPPATFGSGAFSGTAGAVNIIQGASIGDVPGQARGGGGGRGNANTNTNNTAFAGTNTQGSPVTNNSNVGIPSGGSRVPATVNAGPLYFRTAPDRNAEATLQIHRGEQYTALGRTADNVWIQLEVGELVGWSMSEYLTLNGDINSLPITNGASGFTGGGNTTTANTSTTGSSSGFGSGTIFENSGVAFGNNAGAGANSSPAGVNRGAASGVPATANGNMRLRSGPGENFDRIGNVDWGAGVSVIGRNADGSWILVVTADGTQGWSAAGWYNLTGGNVNDLPVVN